MVAKDKPGNTNWMGGLSTVDLLIKFACFVKKVNKCMHFQKELICTSWYKEVNGTDPSRLVSIPWTNILACFASSAMTKKKLLKPWPHKFWKKKLHKNCTNKNIWPQWKLPGRKNTLAYFPEAIRLTMTKKKDSHCNDYISFHNWPY